MAVPLISYPFRLAAGGVVAVVEEGRDQQVAEELVTAVLTKRGERVLVPDFGIADPVFVGFDADALRLHVEVYGPPVDVTDVAVQFLDDRTQDVVISFATE